MTRPASAGKTDRKTAETRINLDEWEADANSDQADPVQRQEKTAVSRMSDKIEFRAHPDIKKKIKAIALEKRRVEADLYREFLINGMELAGYKL